MERPRQSIFGEIQIHVGNNLGPINPPMHKEETRGKLQRICNQVEECGINGLTTPHQSRRKFHVRGHSTFSILWHVGHQYFCGVRGLNVFCGEIRICNKERKNCRHWASMREKKRIVPDEHVQTMSRERKSKIKSHMARDELVTDFPHSSSYAQVFLAGFPSPQKFVRKRDRDFDSSYPRGNKEKRAKVYCRRPILSGLLVSL